MLYRQKPEAKIVTLRSAGVTSGGRSNALFVNQDFFLSPHRPSQFRNVEFAGAGSQRGPGPAFPQLKTYPGAKWTGGGVGSGVFGIRTARGLGRPFQ
jgi:hypothetical protein